MHFQQKLLGQKNISFNFYSFDKQPFYPKHDQKSKLTFINIDHLPSKLAQIVASSVMHIAFQ